MNILSWLTSGSKVVDDVFDSEKGILVKAGGFINDLNLTDAEMQKAYTEFYKSTLEESTQRSKTRRMVAERWIDLQISLIRLTVIAIIGDFAAIQLKVYTSYELAGKISEVTFSPWVWGVTSGIAAFFFGTHMLRSSKAGK
jgi:hypothetical protein